jgi:hypothetical protein
MTPGRISVLRRFRLGWRYCPLLKSQPGLFFYPLFTRDRGRIVLRTSGRGVLRSSPQALSTNLVCGASILSKLGPVPSGLGLILGLRDESKGRVGSTNGPHKEDPMAVTEGERGIQSLRPIPPKVRRTRIRRRSLPARRPPRTTRTRRTRHLIRRRRDGSPSSA